MTAVRVPAVLAVPPGDGRGSLPSASSVLAVCAHPDDESFGLGGVLDAFAHSGADIAVLCFTHGEQSTLGDRELLCWLCPPRGPVRVD